MPADEYPIDAIGNPVRKNDLVRVSLTESALIFRVADVQPAGLLSAPNGDRMALQGTIVIQAIVPVKYDAGVQMQNILVLKTPEPDSIHVPREGEEVTRQ